LSGDVAVLLNAQAKGVTPRVVRSISRRLPKESVFVSNSIDEAQEITHEIMARRYRAVLTGGGDGTLVKFLNHSIEYLEQAGGEEYPLIGVLKLGTGNGIGAYVGADSYLEDLQRMVGSSRTRRRRLSLIKVEGTYCHFGGFGLDAAIINDYVDVKETWLGKRLKYAVSVPGVSLPRQLTTRRHYPVGRIINEGEPAYAIGPQGQPIGRPIETGETIYQGPLLIAGVATMPYYGYKLKLYPYTENQLGKMQLRLSWASTFETLSRLPWLWRGTYRSKTIRDYYCDKVRMVFDEAAPLQIGGDGMGRRREATFTVAEREVELIDLSRQGGSSN
jgi:diacylglycerol kinase family enzyme